MRDPKRVSEPLPSSLQALKEEPTVQAFISNVDATGHDTRKMLFWSAVTLQNLRNANYDYEDLTLKQFLWRGFGLHHGTVSMLDRVHALIADLDHRGHFPIRMSVDGTTHNFSVEQTWSALGRAGVAKLLHISDDASCRKVLRDLLRAHAILKAPLSIGEIRKILDVNGEHAAADFGSKPKGKSALRILREEFNGIIDGTNRVKVPAEVKKWLTNRAKRSPTVKAALGR